MKENACPKIYKARNIPIMVGNEVENELKKLVEDDVIEKVESSEWVSPIVVARRSNGNIRLCIDLLHLNIVVNQFPLLRITEMLALVGKATFFSCIDLSAAYQIVLYNNCKKYTAFITPFGCFQFKRMPFGLASAAAVFQRVMHNIFNDCKNAVCFQDGILVFGDNKTDHDHALEEVLGKLRTNCETF